MALSRINSNMVGAGDVSNTEHAYLNSISSNVQTQIAGAGVQTYRSSFTIDRATTGSQAVTGVGFTPKAIFAMTCRNTQRSYSFGQSAGANGSISHGCMFGDYNDVSGSMAVDTFLYRNDGNSTGASPNDSSCGIIASWDSDGFTVTKTIVQGSPTGTLQFYYTCIG